MGHPQPIGSESNHIQFQKYFMQRQRALHIRIVLHTYMVALTTYDALSSVPSLHKTKMNLDCDFDMCVT
jgi:hypothetical protein